MAAGRTARLPDATWSASCRCRSSSPRTPPCHRPAQDDCNRPLTHLRAPLSKWSGIGPVELTLPRVADRLRGIAEPERSLSPKASRSGACLSCKAPTGLRRIELGCRCVRAYAGLGAGQRRGAGRHLRSAGAATDQRPRRLPVAQRIQPRGPGFRVSARSQSVIDRSGCPPIARAGLRPSRRRTSPEGRPQARKQLNNVAETPGHDCGCTRRSKGSLLEV